MTTPNPVPVFSDLRRAGGRFAGAIRRGWLAFCLYFGSEYLPL
jgi:hypothetical protein